MNATQSQSAIQAQDLPPSTDRALLPLALTVALLGASCERAYFAVMESLGVEKRGILVERVEEARDVGGLANVRPSIQRDTLQGGQDGDEGRSRV